MASTQVFRPAAAAPSRPRGAPPACRAAAAGAAAVAPSRRAALVHAAGLAAILAGGISASPLPAAAVGAYEPLENALCSAECAADLASRERVKTASGLEYVDLKPGTGAQAPVGYQVVVNYVASTPAGNVFDSSLAKGYPYYLRVGAGQVVAGLDEGLLTMKVGGVRRLFVPGPLAFPKGLPAGPGRPRVAPSSPIVFDVELLSVPGLDEEE